MASLCSGLISNLSLSAYSLRPSRLPVAFCKTWDVSTKDNRLYWTDGVSVFVSTEEGDSVIVQNRSGVRSLSLIGEHLWLSEVTPSGPFLVRFNLSQEVLQEEIILSPEQIPSPLVIDHMVAGDDDELWLTVGFLEQWPYSSLLCRLVTSAQRFGCVTHTPPRSVPFTMFLGQLLWRHQFGIAAYAGEKPYTTVYAQNQPGGSFVDGEHLLISDLFGGRILKLPLGSLME